MSKFNRVQDASGVFVDPTWGVGFGGQGAWHNRHFADFEAALAFYTAHVQGLPACYRGMQTKQVEETDNLPGWLFRKFTIFNITKRGAPGKLKQSVQLYQIVGR